MPPRHRWRSRRRDPQPSTPTTTGGVAGENPSPQILAFRFFSRARQCRDHHHRSNTVDTTLHHWFRRRRGLLLHLRRVWDTNSRANYHASNSVRSFNSSPEIPPTILFRLLVLPFPMALNGMGFGFGSCGWGVMVKPRVEERD